MNWEPARRARTLIAEVAVIILLVSALLAGGGPRGWGDRIVEWAALPVVLLACLQWKWTDAGKAQRAAFVLLACALGWMLVQLIPMPPGLYARLPMRGDVSGDLSVAGVMDAWRPATLDVWGSVRAIVTVAVVAATWLLLCSLSERQRFRIACIAIGLGCAMAILGYAQAAAGDRFGLRLYEFHHSVGAIGLFANRNHFACLMAMLVAIAMGAAQYALGCGRRLQAALLYASAAVMMLAAALSFSRTGIVLTCVAVLAGLAFLVRQHRTSAIGAIVAVGVATAAVMVYAWDGIERRLQQDPLQDLRWQYVRHGWAAARAYLPWGSGPGTFRDVYAPFEPTAAMHALYAAHAHNDFLEVLIETGIPGGLIVLALTGVMLCVVCNSRVAPRDSRPIFVTSLMAVSIPVMHSLVDYPLRTYAVAIVLALAASVALSPAEVRRH